MSPRRSVPDKAKAGGLPFWFITGAVAIVAVVVVIVGVDFATKSQAPVPVPVISGVAESSRTVGNPNASVAFLEFSDFQ